MNQYRITKYNPDFRKDDDSYTIVEWTDFSDVGKTFNGFKFTINDYLNYENFYVETVLDILKWCNISNITVKSLENNSNQYVVENEIINYKDVPIVVRDILRNKMWCKLESKDFFVHFGYDYYMYIGCNLTKLKIVEIASKNNLFCEEMDSPY